MKVSERWLREFVNPKVSTETWMMQFTQLGIEVDSVETVNQDTDNQDTVITLKLPPNRSDCLSMEGLAREWAAINHLAFVLPARESVLPKISDTLPLTIQAIELCPRYVGRIVQNINAQANTPEWLKERLEKAGIRSLSPVVDVTNYVMLEMGQPMHAFDLAKIDSEIIVRKAKTNETLTTLEGKTVTFNENNLVIADKKKPLAIAGIMGGEASAVSPSTKNIFLEAAYFEPVNIRKTSQQFKLRTESSLRFERGIDPQLAVKAMERATELLVKIVGGNVAPLTEYSDAESLGPPTKLFLRSARIQAILGIDLKKQTVQDILSRLGMTYTHRISSNVTALPPEGWEVLVPSFRPDITLEIDLIEELARLYGYQHIPEALPLASLKGNAIAEGQLSLAKIKNVLISRGYREAITYSFISPELHRLLGDKREGLTLTNPISQELSIMRESLLPGLLQTVHYNQARQILRLRLFEIGTVFLQEAEGTRESAKIAGVMSGSAVKEQWGKKTENLDFFDIKNDVEALLNLKGEAANRFQFTAAQSHHSLSALLHPGQAAVLSFDDKPVGFLGAVHPAILKQLDLQGPVMVFEVSLSEIQTINRPKFRELSKYPAIRRDIAVMVDEKVLAEELKSAIVNCVGSLLREVWVFDVYQGKNIAPGRKSVALGLLLQHPSQTLVEDEINEVMSKVFKELADKYHAILRE